MLRKTLSVLFVVWVLIRPFAGLPTPIHSFMHGGGGALAIAPCRLRETTHSSAVEVVATSQHIEFPISLPVPPALNTRFTARAANGTIYVSADTSLPMTQALVWLGIPDEQRVAWSSEDTNTGTITDHPQDEPR
jgi:hypothetical protein